MQGLSIMDHILGLPPLEKAACIVIQICNQAILNLLAVSVDLRGRTSLRCEIILLVAWPSAREVSTETAVAPRIVHIR